MSPAEADFFITNDLRFPDEEARGASCEVTTAQQQLLSHQNNTPETPKMFFNTDSFGDIKIFMLTKKKK